MQRVLYVVLMVVMVAGLLLACGPKAPVTEAPEGAVPPEKMTSKVGTPGITADAVYIAFNADITRKYGFANTPRLLAIQDAAWYANENLGGIAGKEVKILWGDHESILSKAVSYYEEFLRKSLLVLTCSSAENEALRPRYLKDRQVAITCGTSTPALTPVNYIFGVDGIHAADTAHFCQWVVEQEEYDPGKTGETVKAVGLGFDSPVCRSFYAEEAMVYAESVGVEYADIPDHMIYIPLVVVDPLTPLMKAKELGAEWLTGFLLWQYMVPLLKCNYERDLGLKFATCAWGVETRTIRDAGPAAEGFVATTPWPIWNDDTPGAELMRKVAGERGTSDEMTGLGGYTMGFQSFFMAKLAIEKAVEECGWDKVTQNDIRFALEEFGPTDIMQGLAKVDYRKDRHWSSMYRVAEVQNGVWEQIDDWRACPDMCPVGGDVPLCVYFDEPDVWSSGNPAVGYRPLATYTGTLVE